MVGFGDRLPTAVARIAKFRDESRAHDRRGEICLMRLVGIGATREQVEETWLPDVLATLRGYARAGAPQDRNDDVRKVARSERPTLEGLGNDLFVAGTPDDVIRGLQRAADMTGCEYLMPSMSGGDDPLAPGRALRQGGDPRLPVTGRPIRPVTPRCCPSGPST